MAEALLRRNLDQAFDSGPDFPHAMLLSRTMAMLDIETADRRRRRTLARPVWLKPLVAVLIAIAILASLLVGYNALHHSPTVPVHSPAGKITRSDLAQMMSAAAGWSDRHGVLMRTTDGGLQWHPAPVPQGLTRPVGNYGGGAFWENRYFLGPDEAWIFRGAWGAGHPQFEILRTQDGAKSWQRSLVQTVASVPSGTLNHQIFGGLTFLDSQLGWMLVSIGADSTIDQIYFTSDGGLHWALLTTNTSGCAWSVPVFASATIGFMGYPAQICSGGPRRLDLIATIDGGRSWNLKQLTADTSTSGPAWPEFVDELHGFFWVHGIVGLLATSDGGHTWTPRSQPPGPPGWLSASEGWAWNRESKDPKQTSLYFTHDGGLTWQQAPSDLTSHISPPYFEVGSVYFVDPKNGFAVLESQSDGEELARTKDGGAHWTIAGPLP